MATTEQLRATDGGASTFDQQAVVWTGRLLARGGGRRLQLPFNLVQCGSSTLAGSLYYRGSPLLCEGWLDQDGKNRGLRLFASGSSPHGRVWFAAVLRESRGSWSGGFVFTNERGAITAEGDLRAPDVLYQQADKALKPGDCGKLVYVSPVQVNDERAPDGTTKRIRFRVERYELCVFVVILDSHDKQVGEKIRLVPNPESGVTIHDPSGKTIHVQGYSAPAKGQLVGHLNGGNALFYGKFAVFVVDGCTNFKFVQYVKQSLKVGANVENNDWKVDGTDPYKILPKGVKADDGATSTTDWPGRFEPPTIGLPFGTQVDLTQDFETYVCCDGKLIGYWTWHNHVSYTAKNGQPTDLQVDISAPTWQRDPASGVNSNQVKC